MPSPSVPSLSPHARILVLGHTFMGDVLMSTPFLANLKTILPRAKITYITQGAGKFVLANNPRVDQILDYAAVTPASLKRHEYAAAFILRGDLRGSLLAYRAGIPLRFGITKEWNGIFHHVNRRFRRDVHLITQMNRLLTALDPPPLQERMEFFPDKQSAARELIPKTPYVVICPGSTRPEKQWPAESFVAWTARCLRQTAYTVVAVGNAAEAPLAAHIGRHLPHGSRYHNLAGRTDLNTLSYVLAGAAVMITNDTGPMHLAAATEGPHVIALFAYSNPKLTGLLAPRHTVISRYRPFAGGLLKHPANRTAIRGIRVAEVWDAFNRFLPLTH